MQLDTSEVLKATTEARLQELGDMLQDCVNLIFFIEGSRYVILSCVPFALYYLLQHLEPKRGDDVSIATSRSTLRKYVLEKYPMYPVHYLAAYLDPQFKNLEPFVQPVEHAAKLHDIAELLEDRMRTLCSNQPLPTPDISEQQQEPAEEPPRKKVKINILQKMRADHSASLNVSQASVLSVDDALKEEMHKYRSVLQIDIDSCPLKWWKEHETQFPHLSKVAREVLAIPATFAPSERVFSKLAQIYCKERLSLGGDVANACLFLSFNSKANRRNE